MAERIVVDPVTRIEGHLRIEVDVDEKGIIQDAFSSGTAVRGIELIVRDRDPRDVWAYVQRICGVCTTTHALASIRSVEDALEIKIPKNAHLIRNIMNGAVFLHDHVVHFYHLHAFDWVDVLSALKADPNETSRIAQSISDWPKSSPGYFKEIQTKIKKVVESGQLGIFANGYWGHKAYKLPPEVNLLAVAHYLEALDWQKEIVKIHTIFGGKNPHPHYVVGGMATPIDINSDNAVHAERLMHVSQIIDEAMEFVHKVYIPDLLAIASYYKDWTYGGGLNNYLCYGDFSTGDISDVKLYRFPRGAILNGNFHEVLDVDLKDPEQVKEFIDHSWYTYDGKEGSIGKHPWEGETSLRYTGPKPPFKTLNTDEKYSWIKSPRWKEHPMETGPLARMLVGYALKREEFVRLIDDTLKKLNWPFEAMQSALGRTIARGLESILVVQWMRDDMDALLANIKNGDLITFDRTKWEPETWPKKAKGVGWVEAPRGSLGHWIEIEDGKTKNYQAVVPTTWNASPRDHKNQIGAYEASLKGTPLLDKEKPLEILRIIHSFDPCLACAVHLTDVVSKQTTNIYIG
ncbi:nickel-dependent hydrogenase large subunit [Parageobacillus thermoglucosidasius]|uniref:nickel-dependent hydrogenase large subunit n=1 Tax=Parageobacillus thermoglucosidasius TaxID=1426 RepID=UPI00025B3908|nr:nickel-dependent hydrogenase large subunit [Parageobacillus thermoglucosidasius]KYD17062.1 Uptake hydrogenase large subunit [Anoxybacillus flavithermus]EID44143.1 [NiFe] hydrogenase, large subunit [Parageobacillus thermoglucosidasius TNO-09.020]OAO84118.1 Uptake hydrogenase large subunit [Parageobacillus thermoglucosidasius]BDG32292.1 hydrogenase 2 large subunit [Parageobacillus thermoglucosidasius]GMO00596.1 nickel-dependent hydrogenase large subunit [Parageobacillus thermoglucosidasius]